MNKKIKPYDEKMQRSYENLLDELDKVRAGRANPHVLDQIRVDYYGSPTPIQQVGNVTVPDARSIVIQPWDSSMVQVISKAILASDLGLNPTVDGKSIRLVFPELTEERRKELSKEIKKKGENAKVAVRNIRRDGNEAMKKQGKEESISEDGIKDLQDEMQEVTDKYTGMIDDAVSDKTREVMTV